MDRRIILATALSVALVTTSATAAPSGGDGRPPTLERRPVRSPERRRLADRRRAPPAGNRSPLGQDILS